MKTLIHYIIIIICSTCCVCCDKSQHMQPANVINIDVENIDTTFDITQLLDFNDKQDLIVLETNDDSLIGDVSNVIIVKNRIFIIDNITHSINVYDLNGRFKYKIQHQGRASNEYIEMTDVYINPSNIYVLDNSGNKIVVYNLMGSYEYTIDISDYWANNIFVINDIIYLVNKWSESTTGLYRLFMIDKQGKLLSKQLPFKEKDCNRYYSEESAYAISDMTYLCYPSDNVIYTILDNGQCKSYLNIDFQEQAMPSEYQTMELMETIKYGIHDKYIYGVERIASSSRYLFISYRYQSERYNTIYDNQTKEYHNIKSLNGKNSFHLPLNKYYITDNYLVAYVDANTFFVTTKYSLNDINHEDEFISQVRNIEKRVKDNDNGVLLLHKLKKCDYE